MMYFAELIGASHAWPTYFVIQSCYGQLGMSVELMKCHLKKK